MQTVVTIRGTLQNFQLYNHQAGQQEVQPEAQTSPEVTLLDGRVTKINNDNSLEYILEIAFFNPGITNKNDGLSCIRVSGSQTFIEFFPHYKPAPVYTASIEPPAFSKEDTALVNFFKVMLNKMNENEKQNIPKLQTPDEMRNWLKDPQNNYVKKLESLDLTSKSYKIYSLPPEIGEFISLKSLNISGQPISSLPQEVEKLTQLNTFFASYTQLRYVPECLKGLAHLTNITLNGLQLAAPSWLNANKCTFTCIGNSPVWGV